MNKTLLVSSLSAAALLAGCRVYLPGESPRRTVFVNSNTTIRTAASPAAADAAAPGDSAAGSDRIAPQPLATQTVAAGTPVRVMEPTPFVGVLTGVALPAGATAEDAANAKAAAESAAAKAAESAPPPVVAPVVAPAPAPAPAPVAALPQTAGPDSYLNYMGKGSSSSAKRPQAPAAQAPAQTAAPVVQQASGGYRIYTVKAGDSAGAIANANGMTLAEFAALNGLSDPNKLRVGQTVKVAAGRAALASGPAQPAAAPAGYVVVQEGDSLSTLAARHGTTVKALMEANGISDANSIRAGRQLWLPGTAAQTPVRPTAAAPVADAQAAQNAVHPIATPATTTTRPVVSIPQPTRVPARVTATEASAAPGSTVKAGDTTIDVDAALSGGGLGAARQRVQETAQAAQDAAGQAAQQVRQAAQDAAQQTQEAARQAAQQVRSAATPGTKEYIVQEDDDIYSIAMKFDAQPLKIRALNGGVSLDDLVPGTRILVPSGD